MEDTADTVIDNAKKVISDSISKVSTLELSPTWKVTSIRQIVDPAIAPKPTPPGLASTSRSLMILSISTPGRGGPPGLVNGRFPTVCTPLISLDAFTGI